jgi:predicted nucleic acid-binding protein
MQKIFIDADVILDLLAKRNPHYKYAAVLFTLIDKSKVKAFTSPVVISNIYYILSKLKKKDFAGNKVRKLRLLLNVLSVDEKVIDLALSSDFKDFEDAIQYYVSVENKMDFIITRNIKDYKLSEIPVVSPEEYIKIVNAN